MSDQDPAIDPIDTAYAEAEALLGDEAARAVRKARVLGAVTLEPAEMAAVAATAPMQRPPSPWRRGGWLAAASVAGIAVLLAARLYQPAREPPPPPASAALTSPTPGSRNLRSLARAGRAIATTTRAAAPDLRPGAFLRAGRSP